jgi:hypothetical protein
MLPATKPISRKTDANRIFTVRPLSDFAAGTAAGPTGAVAAVPIADPHEPQNFTPSCCDEPQFVQKAIGVFLSGAVKGELRLPLKLK